MSANKERKLIPDKIHITDTQIVKCNIDCPLDFIRDNVQGFEYDLDFNLAFNTEDDLVKADFELTLTTKSKEFVEIEAQGNFHFVYVYHIENFKDLVVLDKNKEIVLHGGLGNALASITYSTSRGILFARLKGTGLDKFSLPVIDPNTLLKVDSPG